MGRTGCWGSRSSSRLQWAGLSPRAQQHVGNDAVVTLPLNYVHLEAVSFSFMHLLSGSWHAVLCVEMKKMTWGSLLSSLAWSVTQYFVYLWEHSFLQLHKGCARAGGTRKETSPVHPRVRALRKQNLAPRLQLTESIFQLCLRAKESLASPLPACPGHEPACQRGGWRKINPVCTRSCQLRTSSH